MDDREVLREIEEFTGHRSCRTCNPAITWARWILGLSVLAVAFLLITGCATTTTRTVITDKSGRVTDTTVVTKAADPAAYALAGVVVTAYAPPRARIVRQEKSATIPGDIRRILRSRPITRQEIAARWKPSPSAP